MKKIVIVCFLLMAILFLRSISKAPTGPEIFIGNIMTMNYKVVVGKSLNSMEKKVVKTLIDQTFQEVDEHYNKWNPHSELSHINHVKASVHVAISHKLEKLLLLTEKMVQITEGRFDPTIAFLQDKWKSELKKNQAVHVSHLKKYKPQVGWQHVHISNGYFFKDIDNLKIDLGGIAKGYCVDLITERLNNLGYPDVYVEWGGEMRATGQHPKKRPWNVYISRFEDTNPMHAIDFVNLYDQSLATSGDYLQFWKVKNLDDGKQHTYCHIIDPIKYLPLEVTDTSISSVTIQLKTCAEADAIATACMMFKTTEDAAKWLNQLKDERCSDLNFWLVTHENKN